MQEAEERLNRTVGRKLKTQDKAIEKVGQLALDEGHATTMFNLAIEQMERGNARERERQTDFARIHFQDAIKSLVKAERFWDRPEVRERPDAVRTLSYIRASLAYAKKRLGEFRDAFELIEKVISFSPRTASWLFNGGCYAALCDLRDPSLVYFRRSIDVEPMYREKLRSELTLDTGDAKRYEMDRDFRDLAGLD